MEDIRVPNFVMEKEINSVLDFITILPAENHLFPEKIELKYRVICFRASSLFAYRQKSKILIILETVYFFIFYFIYLFFIIIIIYLFISWKILLSVVYFFSCCRFIPYQIYNLI